jgi:head-tail adaptor
MAGYGSYTVGRYITVDLLTYTYTAEEGHQRRIELAHKVWARVENITRAEYFEAERAGIRPELCLSVRAHLYRGQAGVRIPSGSESEPLEVYRTYTDSGRTSLFLRRR